MGHHGGPIAIIEMPVKGESASNRLPIERHVHPGAWGQQVARGAWRSGSGSSTGRFDKAAAGNDAIPLE